MCDMKALSTALDSSHPDTVAMPMFRSLLRGANPLCHAAIVGWWPEIGMPIQVVISDGLAHCPLGLDMLIFSSTALVSVAAIDCSSIWPWQCAAMAAKSIFHPMTVHLSELWGVGGLCALMVWLYVWNQLIYIRYKGFGYLFQFYYKHCQEVGLKIHEVVEPIFRPHLPSIMSDPDPWLDWIWLPMLSPEYAPYMV